MKIFPWIVAILTLLASGPAWADEVEPLLRTLAAVGPGGAGQHASVEAWDKLVQTDPQKLPVLLAALDHAGPLAANWIRTAIDTIAQRQLQRGGSLPAADLEAFALDRQHAPRARRLAYEWLIRVDASASERLASGMLDDPSGEMRRDGVAHVIGQAEALEKKQNPAAAIAAYQKALDWATDVDQIQLMAGRMKRLGKSVDVPRQLGLIVRWKLIGPFDNTGGQGFDRVYPPERENNFVASYPGKHGDVRWIDHVSSDESGQIDLNRALATEKAVVGYAATEFVTDAKREVEFRMASFNALKLWLNGRLIDQHNVYHGGSQMDQYICRAVLEPGRNQILVKVCQNSQTQPWAVHWWFQLRISDARGKAVLSADRDRPNSSDPGKPAR